MPDKKIKRNLILFTVLFSITLFGSLYGKNAIWNGEEGWKNYKKGSFYKAIGFFKSALNDNPDYSKAISGLAKCYFEIEVYDESLELYNRLIKLNRNSFDAHLGIGQLYIKKGLYSSALKYFQKAEKISPENRDAAFGIASLYYAMDKKIWAKQKADYVLKHNPYHFKTLLLMADIVNEKGRFNEARRFVEKAIGVKGDSPEGYIKLGNILFTDYLRNRNRASLDESIEVLKNAVSINPESYNGNRTLGNIYLSIEENDPISATDNYNRASEYFKKAMAISSGSSVSYSYALSREMAGDVPGAGKSYLKIYGKYPSDSLLKEHFSSFLIMNDYKIGSPERIMLGRENFDLAKNRMRKNLPDQAIMYLRKSIILNPLDVAVRDELMNYYSVLDYNRFYIDELKAIQRMRTDEKYRAKLVSAIHKRRENLYHREGYSRGLPKRDVPSVLVLNFNSNSKLSEHLNAGEVIGTDITFLLKQFGRMNVTGIRTRSTILKKLKTFTIDGILEELRSMIKSSEINSVDYIIYGSYNENSNNISVKCNLLDFRKGIIINKINVSESGKESCSRLSLRIAKKVFKTIPYRGHVLKLKENGIIVNLGLFDGIKKSDYFVITKFQRSISNNDKIKNKMIFKVIESNTLVSYAVPVRKSDLDSVDSRDFVYPLKKRRAKLIE